MKKFFVIEHMLGLYSTFHHFHMSILQLCQNLQKTDLLAGPRPQTMWFGGSFSLKLVYLVLLQLTSIISIREENSLLFKKTFVCITVNRTSKIKLETGHFSRVAETINQVIHPPPLQPAKRYRLQPDSTPQRPRGCEVLRRVVCLEPYKKNIEALRSLHPLLISVFTIW